MGIIIIKVWIGCWDVENLIILTDFKHFGLKIEGGIESY